SRDLVQLQKLDAFRRPHQHRIAQFSPMKAGLAENFHSESEPLVKAHHAGRKNAADLGEATVAQLDPGPGEQPPKNPLANIFLARHSAGSTHVDHPASVAHLQIKRLFDRQPTPWCRLYQPRGSDQLAGVPRDDLHRAIIEVIALQAIRQIFRPRPALIHDYLAAKMVNGVKFSGRSCDAESHWSNTGQDLLSEIVHLGQGRAFFSVHPATALPPTTIDNRGSSTFP